jgi:hypothetical protein
MPRWSGSEASSGACVKAEKRQPGAAELERWLRAVCDEAEAGELQVRLANDSAAAEFHETRDLVRELRSALQPEPLPQSLVTAINRRIRTHSAGSRRILRLLAPLAAAAAAALAIVALSRYDGVSQSPATENTVVALSSEDAADIVAANIMLSWDGQFQTTVNEIASEVGGLEEAAEQISQAGMSLPWSTEDDWDAATTEGQSRGGFDRRA